MDPSAELLDLPAPYGTPKKKLSWPVVRAILEEAKQYWLATVRPDGRPHDVPLDGIWLDDLWYYGGTPDTLHHRTVLANPSVALHLPDPWKVVIVHGTVRLTTTSPALAQRLADLSNKKYAEYGITNDASTYADVLALHPRRAIAWLNYPADATRFTFTG